MMYLFDKIIAQTKISNSFEPEYEFKKAGLLRIIAGIIIFVRFFEIFVSEIYLSGYTSPETLLAALLLFFVFLFTIGLFTPFANFVLLVLLIPADAIFKTNTLGSTIAIEVLLVFFLVNSGQYFSADHLLIRKNNAIARMLLRLYNFIGTPGKTELKRAFFLGFLLYAISSLFALILHVQDPFWIGGVTVKSMLTNTFLCKHALFFRQVEASVPYLLDVVSICGIILQSVFQILMIPLVFFKAGKRFVVFWGFVFFITSFFFLSLSYLPHLEIVLWLLIFCPFNPQPERIKILYDDKCNLCKRALRFLKLVNFNKLYEFVPVSNNKSYYEQYNLTETEVKTYMVGFYRSTILKGYDLYLLIVKKNPVICLLYPVFWLGKITRLGYVIYNAIARNRYKLLGTCEITFDDEVQRVYTFPALNNSTKLVRGIYFVYFIVIAFFVLFNIPGMRKLAAKHPFVLSAMQDYIRESKKAGLEIPEVFNYTDLSMGDHFMVLRKKINDRWELIPINGFMGERLNYQGFDVFLFSNHNSDVLYFGQTLKYRRKLIDGKEDVVTFHTKGFGRGHLHFLIRYDYSKNRYSAPVDYQAVVFSSNASKAKLFENNFERYQLNVIYSSEVTHKK